MNKLKLFIILISLVISGCERNESNEKNKSNFNNFDENKNKDYIEVDYEKNKEEGNEN